MGVLTSPVEKLSPSSLSDAEVVRRVREGETALYEILMRRHNQLIYRTIRAVLKDEADVEDAMQQAYINAFRHLHQFEERAKFSTWLTRIALNEAFHRRKARPMDRKDDQNVMDTITSPAADPERQTYAQELRRVLESAVDSLPDGYRAVFMLRDVEGLSTSEAGQGLGLSDEAVKTRLHRARGMIRRAITAEIGQAATESFHFHAVRCDRVVAAVMAKLHIA
jgi:RNA polymerase sigma-70 factor (ECF subfamily)